MSLYVEEKGGSSIPPLAEGSYPAVCIALVDMGEQFSPAFEKYTRKVAVGWEIVGETVTVDGETVPRTFYNTYTASLSSKGNLRKDLTAWRGRDFTAEELKKFDLRNILGAPCLVQVVHKKSADGTKTFANLAAVMKMPKGLEKPTPQTKPLAFDIESSDPDMLENFPEWIANRVRESRTFIAHQEEMKLAAEKPNDFKEIGEEDGELPF